VPQWSPNTTRQNSLVAGGSSQGGDRSPAEKRFQPERGIGAERSLASLKVRSAGRVALPEATRVFAVVTDASPERVGPTVAPAQAHCTKCDTRPNHSTKLPRRVPLRHAAGRAAVSSMHIPLGSVLFCLTEIM
jgi:hypothetical protein